MANVQHILDIGSSKMRYLVVEYTKKTSKIITLLERSYDGFADSQFFNREDVVFTISEMVKEIVLRTRLRIKKLNVIVPSEFCLCVCKHIPSTFIRRKKVTSSDVQILINEAAMQDNPTQKLINFSPMRYTIDNDVQLVSPIGVKTQNLDLDASYILCKKYFVDVVEQAMQQCNIDDVQYISSALAQSLVMPDEMQLGPIAVLDIGHITTSVSILIGEGLSMLSSISIGSGHITADIMSILHMSYVDADVLKRKAVLTIRPESDARYEIEHNGKQVNALIGITNKIIRSRIESIADIVSGLLSMDEMYKGIPIYLTGDGVTHMRGAADVLSAALKCKVYVKEFDLDYLPSKYQSSIYGSINIIKDLV